MSFSIAHGLVINNSYEKHHCSNTEYLSEFSLPHEHGDSHEKKYAHDACETHYMFHLSFLLPDVFAFSAMIEEEFTTSLEASLNHYAYQENTFRPPIV
jgi:hypothetical protein